MLGASRKEREYRMAEKEFKELTFDEREEDSRLYEGKSTWKGEDDHAMDLQDDEDMVGSGGTREDNEFDEIVGHLEEIILEPGFQRLQNKFFAKYCHVFEDSEENKLEYTEVFNEFTDLIESYLENCLRKVVQGFRMDRFAHLCQKRQNEIAGDIFDILLSCGDFDEFKSLMLSHKASMEGSSSGSLYISAATDAMME